MHFHGQFIHYRARRFRRHENPVQPSYSKPGTATSAIVAGRAAAVSVPSVARVSIARSDAAVIAGSTGAVTMKLIRLLPDLPTIAEVAVPGFEYDGWYGIFVPSKTAARDSE